MRIWLLKDGETLPTDGLNIRLGRVGMIAKELHKNGHEVLWWTSSFDHTKKSFRINKSGKILVPGIKTSHLAAILPVTPNYQIYAINAWGYKKNISLRRIIHNHQVANKFVKLATNEPKPDIIISSMPTIELAYAATKYGKKNNVPVILDCVDMWPDIMVMIQPNLAKPFARIALHEQFAKAKWACRHATAIFAHSPEFLKWALKYAEREKNQFDAAYHLGYPEEPIAENLLATGMEFWKKYKLRENENDFVISFVGSLTRSFDLETVITAVKQLASSVKLVIAGIGPMREKYIKLAGDSPNIILPGWLEKYQVRALLHQSHLGIAPYIQRRDFLSAITNKIAEYTAASLPIVTSLNGVLGDFLLKNSCGLIYEGNNINSFITVIKQLKSDPALWKTMSQNAYKLYQKELVAEKIYFRMAKNIENIALRFN